MRISRNLYFYFTMRKAHLSFYRLKSLKEPCMKESKPVNLACLLKISGKRFSKFLVERDLTDDISEIMLMTMAIPYVICSMDMELENCSICLR